MPDLTGVLFDWDTPISSRAARARPEGPGRALHAPPWTDSGELGDGAPWCPLRERVTLICRPSLERPGPAHDAVAERLLPGWDAWDRLAPGRPPRSVADAGRRSAAARRRAGGTAATLIHGDLKLANVGIAGRRLGRPRRLADGQLAPVAIELGWFLVSNVASLPLPPDEVIRRYRATLGVVDLGCGATTVDGLAVVSSTRTASTPRSSSVCCCVAGARAPTPQRGSRSRPGVSAADDLAWWCERAVEAADRLF